MNIVLCVMYALMRMCCFAGNMHGPGEHRRSVLIGHKPLGSSSEIAMNIGQIFFPVCFLLLSISSNANGSASNKEQLAFEISHLLNQIERQECYLNRKQVQSTSPEYQRITQANINQMTNKLNSLIAKKPKAP